MCEKRTRKGVDTLLFVLLCTDFLLTPSLGLPAAQTVLGNVVALLALASILYCRARCTAGNTVYALLVYCMLCLGAVGSFARIVLFWRVCAVQPVHELWLWAGLAVVCVAACYAGAHSVSNVAGLLACAVTLFAFLLLVADSSEMQTVHLNGDISAAGVFACVGQRTEMLQSVLLVSVLRGDEKQTLYCLHSQIIALLAALCFGTMVCLVPWLVLGSATHELQYPLRAAACVGVLSVFRRLDTVHTIIWLCLGLFKMMCFFAVGSEGLSRVIPWKKGYICVVVLAVSVLFTALLPQLVPLLQMVVGIGGGALLLAGKRVKL